MAPSSKLFPILKSSSHLSLLLLLFPQALVFPPLGSIREKCLFPWVALGGECEEVMHTFTFVSFAWPQWTTAADGCSQFIVLDVLSIGSFLWLLDDLQVPSWAALQLHHWMVLWRHDHFLLTLVPGAPYSFEVAAPTAWAAYRFHLSKLQQEANANALLF